MYLDLLKKFINNINALKYFVDNVQPVLILSQTSAVEKRDIVFKKFLNEFEDLQLPSDENDKIGIPTDLQSGDIEKEDKTINKLPLYKTLKEMKVADEEVELANLQTSVLYQSSLISLVVFMELLISNLIQNHLSAYPEIIQKESKSLTLEQIRELGSFKEADKFIITREAEKLMREGFYTWYEYLEKRMKLKVGYVDTNLLDIIEIFQRRNLVVHNGGIVNSIYLSKVDEKFSKDTEIGNSILITKEYIENAIDKIEISGILLLLAIWEKSPNQHKDMILYLSELGYDIMLEERWLIAQEIYKFIKNYKKSDEIDRTTSEVNYWQCVKWSNRFDEIKIQVNEADYSAKSMRFQICLVALQEDYDKFFKLIRKCCPAEEENGIGLSELMEWPVFKLVREKKEYREFLLKNGIEIEEIGDEQCIKNLITTDFDEKTRLEIDEIKSLHDKVATTNEINKVTKKRTHKKKV